MFSRFIVLNGSPSYSILRWRKVNNLHTHIRSSVFVLDVFGRIIKLLQPAGYARNVYQAKTASNSIPKDAVTCYISVYVISRCRYRPIHRPIYSSCATNCEY